MANALETIADPLQLPNDIAAALLEAFGTAMRQPGDAGWRVLAERLGTIGKNLLTYAPLGAKPHTGDVWTQAAQALGYVDNPELAGTILSLLTPDPLSFAGDTGKVSKNLGALIDVREGPGSAFNELRQLGRKLRHERRMSPDAQWDTEAAHKAALELQQQGILVGYRTAGITGYGSEGAPVVFTTMFPDLAKDYKRSTGARAIIGYRIPPEAKIYQNPEENYIPKLYKEAMEQGAHVIQRKRQAHELILTPKFFEDFPDIRPEPVRMSGRAPVAPFKPTTTPVTEGGDASKLAMERLGERKGLWEKDDYTPTLAGQYIFKRIANGDYAFDVPASLTKGDTKFTVSGMQGIDYLSEKGGFITVDAGNAKRTIAVSYNPGPHQLLLHMSTEHFPLALDYVSVLTDSLRGNTNAKPFKNIMFASAYRGDYDTWAKKVQSLGVTPPPIPSNTGAGRGAKFEMYDPTPFLKLGTPKPEGLDNNLVYLAISPKQVEALRRGEDVYAYARRRFDPHRLHYYTSEYTNGAKVPVLYRVGLPVKDKYLSEDVIKIPKEEIKEVLAQAPLAYIRPDDWDAKDSYLEAFIDVTDDVLRKTADAPITPAKAQEGDLVVKGAKNDILKRYIERNLEPKGGIIELPKDTASKVRVRKGDELVGESVSVRTSEGRKSFLVMDRNPSSRMALANLVEEAGRREYMMDYIESEFAYRRNRPLPIFGTQSTPMRRIQISANETKSYINEAVERAKEDFPSLPDIIAPGKIAVTDAYVAFPEAIPDEILTAKPFSPYEIPSGFAYTTSGTQLARLLEGKPIKATFNDDMQFPMEPFMDVAYSAPITYTLIVKEDVLFRDAPHRKTAIIRPNEIEQILANVPALAFRVGGGGYEVFKVHYDITDLVLGKGNGLDDMLGLLKR